jgi:cell division septation protein DedD
MARSSTGKSVARAAATGGGTTYRGQMPVNWYAALVIIVVVGIASVVLARYDYAKGGPPPTTNQTWHAALAIDICGTTEPALTASAASATNGLVMSAGGVMVVHPVTSSQSGDNATLGKFASEYQGLKLTDSSLQLPTDGSHRYANGQTCPKGTPDAGRKGVVRVRTWVLSTAATNGSFRQVGGQYAPSPTGLKLLDRQLITLGFGPSSAALPKPPASTVKELEQALEGLQPPVTTTTAAPATTPTTAAGATTTSVATTTTAPPATSTTKPSTTTTAKPK